MQPTGLGLYVTRIPAAAAARTLISRMAGAGLSWCAVGGPWHDAKQTRLMNDVRRLGPFCRNLEQKGIRPWIWGYPWHDRVDKFVDQMLRVTNESVAGWLLDPELGMKGQPTAARVLVAGAVVHCENLGIGCGWTSYGMIEGHIRGRNAFPFEPFRDLQFASPQLYTNDKHIAQGLAQYVDLGFKALVPSFGCYLKTGGKARPKTAAELHEHLSHFIDVPQRMIGMIGWQSAFMRSATWPVLRRWSSWIDRGACMLPET